MVQECGVWKDGRVTDVHRVEEVLDATLTGLEYAQRRAEATGGHVVVRTVATMRSEWVPWGEQQ